MKYRGESEVNRKEREGLMVSMGGGGSEGGGQREMEEGVRREKNGRAQELGR